MRRDTEIFERQGHGEGRDVSRFAWVRGRADTSTAVMASAVGASPDGGGLGHFHAGRSKPGRQTLKRGKLNPHEKRGVRKGEIEPESAYLL